MTDYPTILDELIETAQGLKGIAASLALIASGIGKQATAATLAARRATEDVQDSVGSVQRLLSSAHCIEQRVRAQQADLDRSRAAAVEGTAVVERLSKSTRSIGAVAGMIGEIAGRSTPASKRPVRVTPGAASRSSRTRVARCRPAPVRPRSTSTRKRRILRPR